MQRASSKSTKQKPTVKVAKVKPQQKQVRKQSTSIKKQQPTLAAPAPMGFTKFAANRSLIGMPTFSPFSSSKRFMAKGGKDDKKGGKTDKKGYVYPCSNCY